MLKSASFAIRTAASRFGIAFELFLEPRVLLHRVIEGKVLRCRHRSSRATSSFIAHLISNMGDTQHIVADWARKLTQRLMAYARLIDAHAIEWEPDGLAR
jgi:hypothetical protein